MCIRDSLCTRLLEVSGFSGLMVVDALLKFSIETTSIINPMAIMIQPPISGHCASVCMIGWCFCSSQIASRVAAPYTGGGM